MKILAIIYPNHVTIFAENDKDAILVAEMQTVNVKVSITGHYFTVTTDDGYWCATVCADLIQKGD